MNIDPVFFRFYIFFESLFNFRRKNEAGEWSGGSMYFLADGLGSKKGIVVTSHWMENKSVFWSA